MGRISRILNIAVINRPFVTGLSRFQWCHDGNAPVFFPFFFLEMNYEGVWQAASPNCRALRGEQLQTKEIAILEKKKLHLDSVRRSTTLDKYAFVMAS